MRKGDKVLLVQRGQEPGKGQWVIPGGVIELGESVHEAVRRELWEECGIEIALGPVAAVVDRLERNTGGRVRYHYVIIDFFADYVSGDLHPATDVAEARWVGEQELAQYDLTTKSRELLHYALRTRDPGEGPGANDCKSLLQT